MSYNVYVISAGRSDNLPFTDSQKKEYFFCVKCGEGELYEKNGCAKVFETGGLIESRNYALRHAFEQNKICVQLSDDLKKVEYNKNFTSHHHCAIPLDNAIRSLASKLEKVGGVYLMGVPPTDNHFFSKNLISKNTFCIGDLLFVKPCNLFFDHAFTLKEDYDYTLQHITKYGGCFRYQEFIFTFDHYKNKGGAVDYRNDAEEVKNIKLLMEKWGNKVRLNPKRKNEILI